MVTIHSKDVPEILALYRRPTIDFPPHFLDHLMHSFPLMYNTLGSKLDSLAGRGHFLLKRAVQAAMNPDSLTLEQHETHPNLYSYFCRKKTWHGQGGSATSSESISHRYHHYYHYHRYHHYQRDWTGGVIYIKYILTHWGPKRCKNKTNQMTICIIILTTALPMMLRWQTCDCKQRWKGGRWAKPSLRKISHFHSANSHE